MSSEADTEVAEQSHGPDMSHMQGDLYEQGEGAAFVEHERNFLEPSRWWFASTAFPLIAGTFGPMASAFSICALADNWRAHLDIPGYTYNQGHQQPIQDPAWLLALNGTSLGIAIIANTFLLLNMIQRCPFSIAQPITAGGFLISSVFLIVMVAIAGQETWKGTPVDSYILTEAYYYACWAAGLYAIIAVLMCITIWGAYAGHYSKDFDLSASQRRLMVQTIVFMAYLLIGAYIYSVVENWPFLNAVYWADFTLLTVGIGDHYVPVTHLGRSLIFPYAVGGIVTLGLVVNAVNGLVLEASGAKLGARSTERKREAVLRTLNYEKGYYHIAWFRKRYFDNAPYLSELDKRKQEFYAMRDILRYAESNRAWRSLAISLGCFCILWFAGAAVFQVTEKAQHWSYFEGLYFSYIILLTIGYGDLEARSNAGRPFFVLWSLLAVPALTVLVGDLSDTVVSGVRSLMDYLIQLAARPKKTMKATVKKIFTPDFLPSNFDAENEGGIEGLFLSRLESDDVKSAERAGRHQDPALRDRRFYQFLLMREIRVVLMDCEEWPPKQYTYEEWCFYLMLLGLDENNASIHCKPFPPIKPDRSPDGSPELFNLARDIDDDGIVAPWSWLGIRSPLMSGKTEPQWIVQRLIIRLQRELHLDTYNGPQKEVPLSLSLFRTRTRTGLDSNNEESSNEKKSE